VKCHVLEVENASEMESDAQEMTYYVNAERYVPARLQMVQSPQQGGGKPTEVVVNFEDYRTTEGITLAWRTTMQMKMDMSEKQRRQMKKMMKQMENLPESQREMMKNRMSMSFDRMKRIMSGEPMTVEVQDVRVNEAIPEGVFNQVWARRPDPTTGKVRGGDPCSGFNRILSGDPDPTPTAPV
jgi:tellurite resistance protein